MPTYYEVTIPEQTIIVKINNNWTAQRAMELIKQSAMVRLFSSMNYFYSNDIPHPPIAGQVRLDMRHLPTVHKKA